MVVLEGVQMFGAASYLSNERIAMLLLAGCAGLALIGWCIRCCLQPRDEAYESPRRLWRDLRRAHGLSYAEARLLSRIAKHSQLTAACELFVEPMHLERAAQSPKFSAAATQIAALSAKLFGK